MPMIYIYTPRMILDLLDLHVTPVTPDKMMMRELFHDMLRMMQVFSHTMEMFDVDIHPRSLTWNLKMMVSNRNLLFQGLIFRFHVNLQGCNMNHRHDAQLYTWRTQCTGIIDCIWCTVWLHDDMTGSEHDNTMHNDLTDMKYIWYDINDIYIWYLYGQTIYTNVSTYMMCI